MGFGKKASDLAKTPIGDLIVGLVFGKFSKLLPVKKVKETDKVIAFWHPRPLWEKHILIVPKKPIKKLIIFTKKDEEYISEIFKITAELVKKLELENKGYSLIVNGGKKQEVKQLHFHLYSGKKL